MPSQAIQPDEPAESPEAPAAAARPGSRTDWFGIWPLLARAVTPVASPEAERALLERLARASEGAEGDRPFVLAFVNASAMNLAAESREFVEALGSANLLLRDGSGMATLMRALGLPPGLNMNGTDLIPKLIDVAGSDGVALFGSRDPWLARAAEAVEARAKARHERPRVARAHGFMETAAYVELARASRPNLIVLAMGMPRQEQVAIALRSALGYPCLVVCGGAIVDFMGGKARRAPRWMRAIGMEWAFRLALEPRRLFRRYVIGNPLFLARCAALLAFG